MKKLRMGIVGIKGMGVGHVEALHRARNIDLKAVCDIDKAAVEKTADKYKAIGFTDYIYMFNKAPIDAVLLCLPHFLYPEVVNVAANKGLHILKEKPFARTYKEALKMVEVTERNKVKLMIGTQRRFNKYFCQAEKLIKRIGRIFLARGHCVYFCKVLNWRANKEKAGDEALLDYAYHGIDLLLWYLGIPNEIFVYAGNIGLPNVKPVFYSCEGEYIQKP